MELDWHKSSHSGANGGDCVEIAETPDIVHMRDTRHRELGHLAFHTDAFTAFIADVRAEHR
ncbi:uncharacterized protein DUF397 [Murinocardiopsis flavida]|uniref:Uncharacterized protein DUF397 n=1 Tax=Murinocardiopsis flavida TaxID=645275 RepID=A0A2P8DQQ7_9ACTN|nr:DUF397 domain-containing protein [Murinocardiopsis flavida]PSK99556.1 uncharacterized protein DUF397 [Murinocardiopsis flavida]